MANVDRITRPVVTVDGAGESMDVTEGVDEEKMAIFGGISLVWPFFDFFLFPGSAEDCVVAA